MRYLALLCTIWLAGCGDNIVSSPLSAGKALSTINVSATLTADVSSSSRGTWLMSSNAQNVEVGNGLYIGRIEWYLYNGSGRIQLRRHGEFGGSGSFLDHWNKDDDLAMTITVNDQSVSLFPLATKAHFSNWGLGDEAGQSVLNSISDGDVFAFYIQSNNEDEPDAVGHNLNVQPQCAPTNDPQLAIAKKHLRIVERKSADLDISFNVSGTTSCAKMITVTQNGPTEAQQPEWNHKLVLGGRTSGFSAKDGGRYVENAPFTSTSLTSVTLPMRATPDELYGAGRDGNAEYDDYDNEQTIIEVGIHIYLGLQLEWKEVDTTEIIVTVVDEDRPTDCTDAAYDYAVDDVCMTIGSSGNKHGFIDGSFGSMPSNVLTIDGTDYTIKGIWLEIDATTGLEHLYTEYDKKLPAGMSRYGIQLNDSIVAMSGRGVTYSVVSGNHRYHHQYVYQGWADRQKVRVGILPSQTISGDPSVSVGFRSSD